MINNEVTSLIPILSNGSVAGIVSMPSGTFAAATSNSANRVFQEVNREQSQLTPSTLQNRYEIEMSKAMIQSLVVHSVPAPANAVQLRRNEVITRLPALALWLLVAGNILFVLLAIAMAVCAIKFSSQEVHQAQLRLSSAGLAAQLFGPDTAQRAARDDFELFHGAEVGDADAPEKTNSSVDIRSTALGGAEFVVQSMEKQDGGWITQHAVAQGAAQPLLADQSFQGLLTRRTF
jgi:hypothetical protein